MKKILLLILTAALLISGCSAQDGATQDAVQDTPAAQETATASPKPEQPSGQNDEPGSSSPTAEQSTEPPEGALSRAGAEELAQVLKEYAVIVNEPLPEAEMQLLDGGTLSTTEFAGGVTLLNFMASWCGWCEYEMPFLAEVVAHYGPDGGVQLVFVDTAENVMDEYVQADVANMLDNAGISAPVMLDEDSAFGSSLNPAGGLPTTLIIDGDGIIRLMWPGAFRDSQSVISLTDLVLYYPELLD